MKFLGMEKVRDGKYLKNYELSYENKVGKLKKYEIVSRRDLSGRIWDRRSAASPLWLSGTTSYCCCGSFG